MKAEKPQESIRSCARLNWQGQQRHTFGFWCPWEKGFAFWSASAPAPPPSLCQHEHPHCECRAPDVTPHLQVDVPMLCFSVAF